MGGRDARPFRILRIVVIFLVFALLPTVAFAQSSSEVVRVGWYESPFNSTGPSGRRSGYAYEYQQEIAAYTGWTYDYVEGTWPELMQMLASGQIDLLSDVSYTEEREESMLFPSLPMGTEEYYLFVEPGVTGYVHGDYGYFNGKRIGVNRGSIQKGYLEDWMAYYGIQAQIVELTRSDTESFEMLRRGELDAYAAMDAFGTAVTAVPEIRIGSSDFYFAMNKSRPDLLASLDDALSRIQEEDRFYNQQLFQKYFSTAGANLFLSDEEEALLSAHRTIRVGYQDDYLAFCAKPGLQGWWGRVCSGPDGRGLSRAGGPGEAVWRRAGKGVGGG